MWRCAIILEAFLTVIVGLKTTNKILIGHDRLVTEGEYGREAATDKVVVRDIYTQFWKIPIGIGAAGSPYLLNDITHNFKLPEWPSRSCEEDATSEEVTDKYVLGELFPAMASKYEEHGKSFSSLVAVNGLLYACDSMFSGVRCADPYDGVGDGSFIAMAALEALLINRGDHGILDEYDLLVAMDVAMKFCRSCGEYSITEVGYGESV